LCIACRKLVIAGSLKVPAVVSSLLAITHGDAAFAANVVDRVDLVWKSPLTCALPDLVSPHSCVSTILASTLDCHSAGAATGSERRQVLCSAFI